MQSSGNMYERGIEDAERDDLNPFYYQHYYYYRQGYDQARRRLRHAVAPSGPAPDRRPVWIGVGLVAALLVFAGLWIARPSGVERSIVSGSAAGATTATSFAMAATAPPRVTVTPSPAPEPSPSAPTLQVGGTAQVTNVGVAALRARRGPAVGQPIQSRLPEGTDVVILEGPVDADGYVWWLIDSPDGGGWSAQGTPEGTVWLTPKP